MRIKRIMRYFEDGNVCVIGLRGRGKDMLQGNVIVRRKRPYISNTNYGGDHYPLELEKLAVSGNTYVNFIEGNVKKYSYPYPDGTDVYISDVGVYFPSQYCSELNKRYGQMAVFQALSRQLGACNFHINVQNLNRCWDKIREQSDIYILCRRCWVFFGGHLVFQLGTIYDRADSAQSRQKPLKLPWGTSTDKSYRLQRDVAVANFEANHGMVKNFFLLYRNKSTYNTRIFKEILENGT